MAFPLFHDMHLQWVPTGATLFRANTIKFLYKTLATKHLILTSPSLPHCLVRLYPLITIPSPTPLIGNGGKHYSILNLFFNLNTKPWPPKTKAMNTSDNSLLFWNFSPVPVSFVTSEDCTVEGARRREGESYWWALCGEFSNATLTLSLTLKYFNLKHQHMVLSSFQDYDISRWLCLWHPSLICANSKKSVQKFHSLEKHDRKLRKLFSYLIFSRLPECSSSLYLR